jgi:hypothetical protein
MMMIDQETIRAARRSGMTPPTSRAERPDLGFGEHEQRLAAQGDRLLGWCAVEFDVDPKRVLENEAARLMAMRVVAELAAIFTVFKGR